MAKAKNANAAGGEIREATVEAAEAVEVNAADTVPEVHTEEKGEETITITKAELNALVESAVASAMANAASAPSQVLQAVPVEDPVILLYLGGFMPGTSVALGELGNIYRDGGTLTVSKENFFSKLNGTAEYLLRKRRLIVVSGLTDEERERYGVLYRENELLTDKMYGRLLSYSIDELRPIYTALCPDHKAIVAKVFRSGMDARDGRVTEEKLKALAQCDRDAGIKSSTFRAMLDLIAPEE